MHQRYDKIIRAGVGSILVSLIMLLSLSTSYAELNENCTVSILNRTAQVKEDGSYVIPNVPSNMGMVRVRATCVENGVTRSGQSDWITIPANGTIDVGDIPLDAFEPSPSAVTLTSSTTTLTTIGGTAQITVTATYPDNSTRDITSGSTGTVYSTTNPAIATVSGNGLVTATGTGRVIISASNDMVLSSLMFTITQADNPDADNDGIPDDWEISNGLNPNDAIDALEDPDHDGLTNKLEYDNATEMHNPDTDSDGIQDGEEVMSGKDGFITNPLLSDSDGDGIRDKLEVQTGSDPTNSASYNLNSALSHLEITPSVFVLVFNSIMTEASRQLTVTGVLIDGNRIDLTSTSRGTSYSSSDLFVANFGAADGRIFAGQAGIAVITASNSGFNAAAQVTVRTFFPTALSYVNIPGFANNVDVSGSYAYVAAGSSGLQVVDVSNPSSPFIAGALDTPGNANDVKIVGQYAYIADGSSGLSIIDINNPTTPLFTGTIDTPETAWDVAVSGTYAYIADGPGGLQILDISNPSAPTLAGSVDTTGIAKGVAVSGDYAVIADSSSVKFIDISSPGNPQIVGTVGITGDAVDVIADGKIAYVAAYTGGLITIDFTDPANPVIASISPPVENYLYDFARFGSFAFGADILRINTSPIYNLLNPLSPVFIAILDFAIFGDYDGTGIAAVNNYLYLTASKGIIENGDTGNTRLFIGQYFEIVDSGATPPTVSITSPVDGAEVFEGAILPITVFAEDDVAVGSVNLLIDGEVVSADYSPPYQFNYQVPVGIMSLAIGATAIDLNNNIGTAPNMFISVLPSPPPVVSITSPLPGSTVIEDSIITIKADATDDTEVVLVDFLINGSVIATDTTAPYQINYLVPNGITSLTIGATAIDNNGKVGIAADVVVNVISDPPPVVSITNPASGATLIEESIITISADATDDSAVDSVVFLVNGSVIATDANAPYQTSYLVPIGITSLTIGAEATDDNGNTGIAYDVVVNVIPDPGTTVTGRVVDNIGQPVEGATVTTLGISAFTGPDGRFSISDVPTIKGDIIVNASAVINNETLTGRSSAVPPVPGGITDVGDIKLRKGIIAIDGGDRHSIALKDDGTVWAWGDNQYGQLGDGTTTEKLTATQVNSLSNMIAIAAGYRHSLAVKDDGTVWAWGENMEGQLGDGTTTDSHTPVQVSGISNVVAVAAGHRHSLALKGDGTVWAWGDGEGGNLGDGTWNQSSTPVQAIGLSDVVAIAAGRWHSLALKRDRSVWAWGSNNYGQLGDGTSDDRSTPVQVSGISNVVTIAAGDDHTLAVKGDGSVWTWGGNWSGQLGDGTTTHSFTPIQVSSLSNMVMIAIAAGGNHSLAIKDDGGVWAWGNNGNGQLGDGTWNNSLTPVQVSNLSGAVIVAAGDSHSLAVKDAGDLWAWGSNSSGKLGDGTWTQRLTPVQVVQLVYISPLNNVAAVAAGGDHSLAVKNDGSVLACGDNWSGQLGDGTWTKRNTLVQVSGLTNVVAAAAGFHSLAVKGDGSAWAWGYNNYGQLGLGEGEWTNKNTPVQVSSLDSVVAVAAGGFHSLAVKSDGSVWASGQNTYGQLGDGTNSNRRTPVQVSNLDGVIAVAAGYYHSLALKADGTVWAWGNNITGQLGNNGWSNKNTPVQVLQYIDNNNNVALSNVVAIAAGGGSHSLALKDDGTIWAWGANYFGQIGDGTTTHWNMSVQVIGLNGVTDISAGLFHSLAVKGDGTVWAWGYNSDGQLGDGTTMNRITPVQVIGLNGAVDVAAGNHHSLALKGDGSVWGWGYNYDGELGDGTWTNNYYAPIQLWLIEIVGFG